MKIYAATKKGNEKAENEDRMVIGKSVLSSGVFQTEEDCRVIAVADGVGGNNAGAVASHFAASKVCQMETATQDFFSEINKELLSQSETIAEWNGMATTRAGFCIHADALDLFSIGNTRVYLLQSRKYLKQLTADDTTLQYLLSSGRLSEEDAKSFDRKNEITACFGGGNPALFRMKIEQTERFSVPFMITSDGIHDYLSPDAMEDILSQSGISAESCEKLIAAARQNGSPDDTSIILGEL